MIEMSVFTLKEISILDILLKHDRTSKMRSLKIVNFYKLLSEKQDGKQSMATIRRNVKRLMEIGLVAEGMKNGREKSYYITQLGRDFIYELNEEAKGGVVND